MARHPAPNDGDDELEDDEPRVRPWRLILGSVFALAGTAGAVISWLWLRAIDQTPEPQGPGGTFGVMAGTVMAWVALAVCAIIAVVGTVTTVTALFEARAARAAGHDESG